MENKDAEEAVAVGRELKKAYAPEAASSDNSSSSANK